MIESLTLADFQTHASLRIDLDPAVTCVVGTSDKGKSSVLRALRLLALNDKSGHRFVRWGQEHATVTAAVDGRKVGRRKGKDVNLYRLDGKEFRAFGQGTVPQEVADLLNVGDENFSGQYDPPLWFLDSAGEVSKSLNRIVNLDQIDRVLAIANRDVRRTDAEVEATETRLADLRRRLEASVQAVKLNDRLTVVESLEAEWLALAKKRLQLSDLVEKVRGYTQARDRQARAVSALANVVRLGEEAQALATRKEDLERALTKYKEKERLLKRLRSPKIDNLLKIREEADALAEKQSLLAGAVREYRELERVVAGGKRAVAEAEADLNRRTKGRCPACLKPLST